MGADVAGQLLVAGLLDEVHLHVAPVLLGQGTGVFGGRVGELVLEGAPVAGLATHLRFRVAGVS
ncbi:dihydrofolate reductase family protein [Amycolatopsis keratiniphila]|uniref:Bifunctional deaminase-reductase domain-containing protein n=1 Tax=Amycolatopsis keratiniphila TaxID=129921 RepID=R4T4H7_9PSEU|nr:dihydrofolate reductase family protein [Amycolatopsis keratiniphila]AGM07326.1 bifunctional deaminase-reductase domain-containing protein [Amycolatopsis keratiniphila]